MAHTEKIFSAFVLAETLPKPTLVRLEQVKYRAVMYEVIMSGPFVLLMITMSSRSESSYSQPEGEHISVS